MARASGATEVTFNTQYFDEIMRTAEVDNLSKQAAEQGASIARHTAPVETGDYKGGIAVESRESRYRRVWMVVGRDPKTLLIEAKTGNLARALKEISL